MLGSYSSLKTIEMSYSRSAAFMADNPRHVCVVYSVTTILVAALSLGEHRSVRGDTSAAGTDKIG